MTKEFNRSHQRYLDDEATHQHVRRSKDLDPFKGCGFACSYCIPSFQLQAKRQKHNCRRCYDYVPHFHPERLDRIPSSPIVFVCGNGDFAFATRDQQGPSSPRSPSTASATPRRVLPAEQAPRVLPAASCNPSAGRCPCDHVGNEQGPWVRSRFREGPSAIGALSPVPGPAIPAQDRHHRAGDGLRHRGVRVVDHQRSPRAGLLGVQQPEFADAAGAIAPQAAKLTGLITSAGIPIIGKTLRGLALPGVG